MTRRRRRVERTAPWLVGMALGCPALAFYYPPMSDLPYHEATIGILRYWKDTARFPVGLYELNLGEPNQLFHVVGWALAFVVSTRWAVKILVAATVTAIPVCAARLARHAQRSELASLLVAPTALGWLFTNGFIANLIGLAVLLAVLPSLDRLGAEPTPRRALAALGAVPLLYFAHLTAMIAYAAAALGLALIHPWRWKEFRLRILPFVAGVAVTIAQAWWQKRYMTAAVAGVPLLWDSLSRKITVVPHLLFPAAHHSVELGLTILWIACVAAFIGIRRRNISHIASLPVLSRADCIRTYARTYRWELLAAGALAAYFAFPLTLNGAMLVYQRWLPVAFAVLSACSVPRNLGSPAANVATLAACLLPLGTLLASLPSFVDSDRNYRDLETLLPQIDEGSAVAGIVVLSTQKARTYSLATGVGRALAARGGRMAYSFADSSVCPVFIPRAYQWEGALARFSTGDIRPAHDLKMFRYLLALAERPGDAQMIIRALAEDARVVDRSGAWLLLESRHPLIPVRGPPLKMEHPVPETLRERLQRIVGASQQSPHSVKLDPPARVRRDSVRVPLSTGRPREDFWQMHESAPLIEPDDQPRPVTVLFHGMCADSSWTCDWLQYFEMAPQWQICPRAPSRCAGEEEFRWTSGAETRRLVELAVARLKERHDGRVREDGTVLAGFSLGAYAVASLVHELARDPSTSLGLRGILAQGARVHFSAGDLRAMRVRVVLTAGDLDAVAPAMRDEAERLRREGIEVRYVSLGKDESHFTSVSTGKLVAQLIDWCRGSQSASQ